MYASIAEVIRISHANFHCNRLATVQDIQDYASLIFLGHGVHISFTATLPAITHFNDYQLAFTVAYVP